MARATFILETERERGFALSAVMKAKIGQQVRISKPTRTLDQNARLHAHLTDIAKQLPWPKDSDEFHPTVWWKQRATLGWIKETGQTVDVIVDLDGDGFGLLLPHTSDLSTEECAALIEWITAFGVTNGVVFTDPKEGPPVPEDYYR